MTREARLIKKAEIRHWQRYFELPVPRGGVDRDALFKWFEDRGAYLRSEYRALIDREFKLPSR